MSQLNYGLPKRVMIAEASKLCYSIPQAKVSHQNECINMSQLNLASTGANGWIEHQNSHNAWAGYGGRKFWHKHLQLIQVRQL
jgi:hypothetical protein